MAIQSFMTKNIDGLFMAIYVFIDWNLWPQKARSAKTKNIYVSFIVIFD